MNNGSLNTLSRTAAVLLTVAAFAGIFLLYSQWTHEGRFWRNWYPLLINESRMNPDLEEAVREISGGTIVSESATLLEYAGYTGLKTISLKDLAQGKGPYGADPRIDPYMRGISSYFNQDVYEILYLPSDKSPLEYQRLFSASELMAGTEWIMPDGYSPLWQALIYALLLLILCVAAPGFLMTALACTAAGGIAFSQGRSDVLLILALTALFMAQSVRGSCRFSWRLILPLLPLAAAWYGNLLRGQYLELAGLVQFCFAASLLWPGKGSRRVLKRRKRRRTRRGMEGKDHSLFEPVSLFDNRMPEQRTAGERPSLLLLSAALLTVLLVLVNLPGEIQLPADIPAAEASGGLWDYEGLLLSEGAGRLPGAAEYMKHRAFHESFMYGGGYTLPVPGSQVSYGDYSLSEGRVRESKIRVLSFSEDWYEAGLSELAGNGPGLLLTGESSPPFVMTRGTVPSGISLPLLLAAAVFICVFVLIHLSGLHHASEIRGIRYSGRFVLRRKQQAA